MANLHDDGCASEAEDSTIDLPITSYSTSRPSSREARFVMMLPSVTDPRGLQIFSVSHPKTQAKAHYATLNGTGLYEVQRVKKEHCSWFINSNVEKAGWLYITTPVDPLLFILPLLLAKASEQFRTLSDIVDGYQAFRSCFSPELLSTVCNKHNIDEEFLFRVDERALMAWLRLKAQRLFTNDQLVKRYGLSSAVEEGEAKSHAWRHMKLVAVGLLGEYVPQPWLERLVESLGLKPSAEEQSDTLALSNDPTPSMKRKAEEDSEKENAKKKKQMTSMGCKALQKVDTKNMKAISSFFGKK
eukprot:EG_transcript_16716